MFALADSSHADSLSRFVLVFGAGFESTLFADSFGSHLVVNCLHELYVRMHLRWE